MSDAWLEAAARDAVRDCVRAIESKTAAEVVVTVRTRSGTYRHVDFALGAAFACAALLVYVYAPITFNDDVAPPAIILCFAAGVALAAALDGLKRLLLRRRTARAQVAMAARAAFVDQGVASTRARNGVLVYVSLLEREVEVVADTGVAISDMGAAWNEAIARLEAALRAPSPREAFTTALTGLGDVLAESMPIGEGDVNELPDEVVG